MASGNECQLVIHAKENEAVVVGCPFAAESIPAGDCHASIRFANGETAPAQATVLTPVMPNGVRWLELSFRAGSKGPAQVELLSGGSDEEQLARQSKDAIELKNDQAQISLNGEVGRAPLELRRADGSALGSLSPEVALADGSLLREPSGSRRKLTMLRNGPLRSQVQLEGCLTDGHVTMEYRLTVELWQGQAAARVDWMLIHNQPQVAELEVERASLIGQWQLGEKAVRRFLQPVHGPHYVPRIVENPEPVTIIADDYCATVHVTDPAMLLDDCEYAPYLSPPLIWTGEWLQLKSEQGCVHAAVAEFADTRPNSLSSSQSELSYHMVPAGQSVSWPQGRRKEQTLMLAWGAGTYEPDALVKEADDILTWGRALPRPEYLAALKCFDQHRVLSFGEPGRNLRFQTLLDTLCQVETPGQMWDLGDAVDHGYTRHYAGSFNNYIPLPGMAQFPRQYVAGGDNAIFPAAAAMMLEPVWTNNEYDMIHMLAQESMRTGKTDHLRLLRWSARHNIEVDFVCYSDDRWHHRATPFHSHRHNMKGAISSHFWTQGLLQYYCLTGDRDALEVAQALGDKIKEIDDSSEARMWEFDREVGWALLALVCLAEAGYAKYLTEAQRIADYLQNYDRAAFNGKVNLSGVTEGNSLERQMVEACFGYASMIEACDRYQQMTGREDTKIWLTTLLGQMKDELWGQFGQGKALDVWGMITMVMAIGYERTGDPEYLDAGEAVLQIFLDPLWQTWAMYPEYKDGKFRTMCYRGLLQFLGNLDRAGRLSDYELPAFKKRREALTGK